MVKSSEINYNQGPAVFQKQNNKTTTHKDYNYYRKSSPVNIRCYNSDREIEIGSLPTKVW